MLSGTSVLHAERTFFGVYRVTQRPQRRISRAGSWDDAARHAGAARYRKGRAADVFPSETVRSARGSQDCRRRSSHENVGVIGLGVGTLAAYAQPGQRWTFYEIDAAVERIARNTQVFRLSRTLRRALQRGDRRRDGSHSRAEHEPYELMVLDAFSSDSIPMHLLTSEALALYLKGLQPRRRDSVSHFESASDARAHRRTPGETARSRRARQYVINMRRAGRGAGRRPSGWRWLGREPTLEPSQRMRDGGRLTCRRRRLSGRTTSRTS